MFVVVQKVFDELFCELGKIPLERVTQTPEIGIPSLGTCASCDTGRTFHGTVPSVEYRTTRVILPLFPHGTFQKLVVFQDPFKLKIKY
jgi:hypothetical protein